jgi:hypothetical protein
VWIEGGSGTASGSVEVTTQLAWMMTRGKGEGGCIIIVYHNSGRFTGRAQSLFVCADNDNNDQRKGFILARGISKVIIVITAAQRQPSIPWKQFAQNNTEVDV